MGNRRARKIYWDAYETELLKLKLQLRWGASEKELEEAVWMGPKGEGTYYEISGEEIRSIPDTAHWLQYKTTFISPYACGSPKLKEVRIVF
jgi:hypothetical protein